MDPLMALVDRLEALVADAGHVPLTNRLIIDEDRILSLLEELRRNIPSSVQQAERVARERDRILSQAREEADRIVREARAYAEQLVKESSIAQRAMEEASRIQAEAKAVAREMREAARQYADDVLAKVEANLQKALQVVRDGRGQLDGGAKGGDAKAPAAAVPPKPHGAGPAGRSR
ncbi:MAG: ATPase [Firmicutes bacterium]|nr:ATPase [Bacillota bacterium]